MKMEINAVSLSTKDISYPLLKKIFDIFTKGKSLKCNCGYVGVMALGRKRMVDIDTHLCYGETKCKGCGADVVVEFDLQKPSIKFLGSKLERVI